MERVVGEEDARSCRVAQRDVLDDRLDRLGSAVGEEAAIVVVRHARDERLREQSGERRAFHLHEVRQRAVHRVAERLFDTGMATTEREDSEAGEEVEVAPPVAVEEVGALGAHVVGVEADRPQYPRHLRVEVALVQRERLACRARRAVPSRRKARCRRVGASAHGPCRHPLGRVGCGVGAVVDAEVELGIELAGAPDPLDLGGFDEPVVDEPARGAGQRGRAQACSCSRARCAPGSCRTPCASSPCAPAPTAASVRGASPSTGATPRCARPAGPHGATAGQRGAGRPQTSASVVSISCNDMLSPPRM